jgi:hypothetical protein
MRKDHPASPCHHTPPQPPEGGRSGRCLNLDWGLENHENIDLRCLEGSYAHHYNHQRRTQLTMSEVTQHVLISYGSHGTLMPPGLCSSCWHSADLKKRWPLGAYRAEVGNWGGTPLTRVPALFSELQERARPFLCLLTMRERTQPRGYLLEGELCHS